MSGGGRMVAFAIGVGDAAPLPYLSGAVNGARLFHEWASKLGYKSHLVIDDETPVTIDRLRDELMSELQRQSSPIERLVIYFAGHGLIREAEEGLWLLSDWHIQMRAVAIEVLKRRLFRFNVGQIAIFADSCRSLPPNMDAADLTPDAVLGRGPSPQNDPPIDKYIAAQDGSTTCMVPGSIPDEDRCLFSGVLMEGLWGQNGGAYSKLVPGKVTSRSLGAFLKEEVPKRATQYAEKLFPSISPTFPEGADIYFETGTGITPPKFPPWPQPPSSPLPSVGKLEFSLSESPYSDALYSGDLLREWRPETPSLKRFEKLYIPQRRHMLKAKSGLAVQGGGVLRLWTQAGVRADQYGESNWWGIEDLSRAGVVLRRSAPVLIEFEEGTFAAITVLPGFTASVLKEDRGVTALIYHRIDMPSTAVASTVEAIAKMESGTLRATEVVDLATKGRQGKHANPVLGAISAYLYDSIDDIESIRRMAYFYVDNGQPIPYDIALLGQLQGERNEEGLLLVRVPAVAGRNPRTREEAQHRWTHCATPEVTGEVGGLWPWMRQGWAFLDDPGDDDSKLITPALANLMPRLTPSRFVMLDESGGHELAEIFGLLPSWNEPEPPGSRLSM